MSFQANLGMIMTRDLAALRREIEAYPDERLIWAAIPGLANSGGVLTLHLCGNLQHFIGTVLGGTDYRRNREAEFSAPPAAREALVAEIERTIATVREVCPRITDAQLRATYPVPVGEHTLQTERFL
ncbi:MAG TPA: DUF1572 family protein, partial [Gemmatimonadales bacterium]|nr:DUF1572 family protein [Gemmatimonadales bacterium]